MDLSESRYVSFNGDVEPGWERIQEYLVKHFPKQEGLGGGLVVRHAGEVVVDIWMGESSKNTAWHPDKPVDMGSAVVGIGTLCIMLLRRHGELDLDDYVIKYWPDFAHDHIKVNQLLAGNAQVSCGTTWWCVSELVRLVDPAHRTIDVFVAEELLPSLNLETPVVLTIPEPSSPSAPIHWAGATARSLAAVYNGFMEMASINTDMPRRCAVAGSGGTHALFDVETEVAYAFLTNNSSHDGANDIAQHSFALQDIVKKIVKELNPNDHQTSDVVFDDAESSTQDHDVSRVVSQTSSSIQTVMKSDISIRSTVTGLLTPKEEPPTCPFCIELGGFCGRCSQWRQTLLDDIIHEPEVLRGVPGSTVMWRMGYWIRSGSKPSDEEGQKMHKLSFPVETITRFLSHSWHANAKVKVMALMCFYNGQAATFTGLLFAFIASVLQKSGALPSMGEPEFEMREVLDKFTEVPWKETRGCYCIVAYFVGYYIVFLFGSRMRDRIALAYPDWPHNKIKTAFLDKLCIHQTDPIKKQKGINAIGAFLIQSERVTILWDATYFTRLWCVFEVAVFRRLNPSAMIEFVPITLGKLELYLHLGVALACVVLSVDVVLNPHRPFLFTYSFTDVPLGVLQDIGSQADTFNLDKLTKNLIIWFFEYFWNSIVPIFILYQWRLHVTSLLDVPRILSGFSAKKANCFSETDRKFVESVIVALYDSLENFDEHVKGSMAEKLNGVVGTDSAPMLPVQLVYRAICVPIFVSAGFDHGLFWNLNTLLSMTVTLGLTYPALVCFTTRVFTLLPKMQPKQEFWFQLLVLLYTTRVEAAWRSALFTSMCFGMEKSPYGHTDHAIIWPLNLPHIFFYGLALIMEKLWSKIPVTDKDLLLREEITPQVISKRRPSVC